MSGVFDKAKIVADIAKIGSEIYGLLIDKSRLSVERDEKIKQLEKELADLKARTK